MGSKTKDFNKLQSEWDKKLKKSGFNDIEHRNTGLLKTWDSRYFLKQNIASIEITTHYYDSALRFLNEHKFENDTEKKIWELHSDGISIENIVLQFKEHKNLKSKSSIHKIVSKLREEMWKLLEKDNE